MQEIIKDFSNGIIEYEVPFLNLSVEELKFTVEAGNTYEGTFCISNSSKRPFKGVLYSSYLLLTFEDNNFKGEMCEVKYRFDGTYCEPGKEIIGKIHIISDCGEVDIPFEIHIEEATCETSLGKIKDLFQFANLARMDWTEAKKIFRGDNFEKVFLTQDSQYRSIYQNLRKSVSVSQGMEEFLIAINKKQKLKLKTDRQEIQYNIVAMDRFVDKLVLTKDHWGYAEVRVFTDAEFIELDQKFLWSDRFIGNTYQVNYYIDPTKLRPGNHYGSIWIKTVYQTLEVKVVCHNQRKNEKQEEVDNRVRSGDLSGPLYSLITNNYVEFRCNHIQEEVYRKNTISYIKELNSIDYSRVKELWNIHGAMVSGQMTIAADLLRDMDLVKHILRAESPIEYGFYLYLRALYEKDEKVSQEIAHQLRGIYDTQVRDWRILWCLLYLDKRYEKNSSKRLTDLKEQYDLGCRSPLIYFEAITEFIAEPMLLRELSDFEIQVIYFGIKKRLLTTNLILQFSYLANKKKYFHPLIFRGLARIYQSYPSSEVLTSICCMLIKGLKRESKYFCWYQLGVESQLRITELYEYYMYTVDLSRSEMLPHSLLLYFIYNSNINDRRKAFLFANIVRYRDKIDSIYRTYIKKIEVFTQKQLEGHNVNQDLVYLYQHSIDLKEGKKEIAVHLPYIMYRHEIHCHNPNMVSVYVVHKEYGLEETQPLVEGRAEVDLYTSNGEMYFLDEKGNRYFASVSHDINPLMSHKQYENYCFTHSSHPMLLLQIYDRQHSYGVVNEEGIQLRKKLLEIEDVNHDIIYQSILDLVDYYYDNYNEELLDYYLSFLDLSLIDFEKRNQYIELFIVRSYYEVALKALANLGFEGIMINRLIKLASIQGKVHEAEKITLLEELCFYVFEQGKYDRNTLNYLAMYYNGPTEKLYQIWEATRGYEIETKGLEERLLTQILFARSYVQDSFVIFQEYYKNNTNDTLVKAYLNYSTYRYIIHDRVLQAEFFQILRRELNYEYNEFWLIGWLKYQSIKDTMAEGDQEFVEYHMNEFIRKGKILPFFQDYHNKIYLPEMIVNSQFVEYRTNPRHKVFIHYRILKPNGEEDYITEQLQDMFMGIHVKSILLFYHEALQYYITEETPEEDLITESYHLTCEREPLETEESKYNQLNLMLMAKELQDEQTLLSMMEQYVALEYKIMKSLGPII